MPKFKKEPKRNPLKRLSTNIPFSTPPTKRIRPTPPPHPLESTIKSANALSIPQLQGQYFPPNNFTFRAKDGNTYNFKTYASNTIPSHDLEACFNLIEQTSEADYRASSKGWNPTHKREEMREEDLRYIIVRPSGSSNTTATPISAFLSFMLTFEVEQPVIYIYEIHTTPQGRGIGLGKHLMQLVEGVGTKVGVDKSMLTVFTRNNFAEELYKRLGYAIDEKSPQVRKLRGGMVKKPEYFVMSKDLHEAKR
ncbi:hypothetical protein EJ08DRAFT_615848 [Tothia fuscella]|uniref:N-alpha-acetyltransferase 40 n=1 Tax=Tothia fuscella TaxID=1048955 RepID=A0A9P4NMD1_9PEZI|nr:hypothetical protein EJ08DRAFT_615848 [Tothia fuscella]